MKNIVNFLLRKPLQDYIPDAVLQSDGTYRCACPLHKGDNSTSFAIFDNSRYYCFSCHSYGNIINFCMERDGISFDMAVAKLADEYGVTISDDDEFKTQMDLSSKLKSWASTMHGNVGKAMSYLKKRGMTDEIIEKIQFGYSDKLSAISIPQINEYNQVCGFIYRFFDGKQRYKNSKNNVLMQKNSFLFGLPYAIPLLKQKKQLWLCEGAFDELSGIIQGIPTIAYTGISVTKSHVSKIAEILKPYKGTVTVVLCPDNDSKACVFVRKARDLFRTLAPNIPIKVAVIPDPYKDLNDIHVDKKDIATTCTYESIDLYCTKVIVQTNEDKDVQEELILQFMKTVSNPMAKADIAEYLSNVWDRPMEVVREFLSVKQDTMAEKLKAVKTVDEIFTSLETLRDEDFFGVGIPSMDETVLLRKTNVFIIGAASFSGKSSLLIEFLLHWCIVLKKKCLFVSLEMPAEDVLRVIISKVVQIPQYKVMAYIKEHPDVYDLINEKLMKYLFILDKNDLSFDDIESYLHLLRTKGEDIEVVAVDYFQYMKGLGDNSSEATVARQMKKFAKETNTLLVMLSQLRKNSTSKNSDGKVSEPTQQDLMGASDIGNSGDVIISLFRPVIANPNLSPIDREKLKYMSKLRILKAREMRGSKIDIELKYNPETSRLTEKTEFDEES